MAAAFRTGELMQVSVSRKSAAFAPLMAMEVRLTDSWPLLVSVIVCGPFCCATTVELKVRLDALGVSAGPPMPCPPLGPNGARIGSMINCG